jgi:hypothetical protein
MIKSVFIVYQARSTNQAVSRKFSLKIGCPSSEYNPFWYIGHVAPFGRCLTAPRHRLKSWHTFDKVGCLGSPLSLSSLKLICVLLCFVLCPSIRGIPFASFSLHGREQGQRLSIGSFFSVNQQFYYHSLWGRAHVGEGRCC